MPNKNNISYNKCSNTSLAYPFIYQVDGIDDSFDFSIENIDRNVDQRINVRDRVATFELNSVKQVAKIRQDAKAPDFLVTPKYNFRNINVECKMWFYAQVANPTLLSLSQDYFPPVLGFFINCESVTKNKDAVGHEFNLKNFSPWNVIGECEGKRNDN